MDATLFMVQKYALTNGEWFWNSIPGSDYYIKQ